MIKTINNVAVNYMDYGEGDNTIVLLHGWGQNIEMMKPIGDRFKKNNRIIIIDLPGFGMSEEPTYVWTLNDYVECVKELLDKLKIENPILIGHSFGGKISLLYASKYKIEKLILFGSPYKQEIKVLSTKTKILKFLKKVPIINKLEGFAKKHIGSTDYRKASDTMRKIMVEHVNLDIEEEVKKIEAPTLLVWGTMDSEVPVERAYELEKIMKDAGVVVYEGCSHYAYLERLEQTIKVLKSFIGG
jgi:pimeloyl-ACP methyl ester carboxylesterase